MSCFLLSELVELCHTSWVAPGVPVRETVGGSPVSTVDALRLPMQAFTVAEAEVMPKTRKAALVQVPRKRKTALDAVIKYLIKGTKGT